MLDGGAGDVPMEDEPPVIEVPERGKVFLVHEFDWWGLSNFGTGEDASLPPPEGGWVLQHDADGFAFVHDDKKTEILSSEVLTKRLLQNTETNTLFVFDEKETLHRIDDWKGKHRRDCTSLPTRTSDDNLKVYIFDRKWVGSRVWWSVKSLFEASQQETPQAFGHWLANALPPWENTCLKFQWATTHVRRAAPTMRHPKELVDDEGARVRILPETTGSTCATILLLARLSAKITNRWASDEPSIRNRSRWRLLFAAFVGQAVEVGGT